MAESKPDASIKPHTEATYTSPNSTLGKLALVFNVKKFD